MQSLFCGATTILRKTSSLNSVLNSFQKSTWIAVGSAFQGEESNSSISSHYFQDRRKKVFLFGEKKKERERERKTKKEMGSMLNKLPLLVEAGLEDRVFQTQDCILPFQQKGLSGKWTVLKGKG